MAQIKIGDVHGLYRVFVGLVDVDGYNQGQSATTPANGTLLSPYVLKYAQNAEFNLPNRNQIDFTGGDVWTGSYVYGITSIGTFSLVSSTVETDLIALLSSSSVDQTLNTLQTHFVDNIILPTPPQAWMMTVFRIQSKEAGSVGADKFITMVFPRVWVSPEGISGAPTFQGQGTYNFTVIPTVGDRMPYGPLLSTTSMDIYENITPNYFVITDNPTHAVTFYAETGATEVVTLPYKPVAYDYATPDSDTQPVTVYVNGVQVDATTINSTTGEITITQAFSGGEKIGVFYETNYEPTA